MGCSQSVSRSPHGLFHSLTSFREVKYFGLCRHYSQLFCFSYDLWKVYRSYCLTLTHCMRFYAQFLDTLPSSSMRTVDIIVSYCIVLYFSRQIRHSSGSDLKSISREALGYKLECLEIDSMLSRNSLSVFISLTTRSLPLTGAVMSH